MAAANAPFPGLPVALVTGASSGIGAAFAPALAYRGYDLILVARRASRLEALAGKLKTRSGAGPGVVVPDLALVGDVERVAHAAEGAPRLRLLVNNAGFRIPGFFGDTEQARQTAMIDVHVRAGVRPAAAALPGMMDRATAGHGMNTGGGKCVLERLWP